MVVPTATSWRDVPSPDAGRIVGSNLRLGHLQGGSSENALQERVCTHPRRCERNGGGQSRACFDRGSQKMYTELDTIYIGVYPTRDNQGGIR